MPERFQGGKWRRLATGAPALEGALVNLDGLIVADHGIGTHSVFIVELRRIQVATAASTAPGLVDFDRSYHALARAA